MPFLFWVPYSMGKFMTNCEIFSQPAQSIMELERLVH